MNRPCAASRPIAAATLLAMAMPAIAQTSLDAEPVKSIGTVTISARPEPTALPTTIPATFESIGRDELQRSVNAFDAEDALKYFPSLLVRKRYVGDYNHAILSSRASGTGNSARSAVYADGILLSNYLGNGVGGLSFPPRWGMVDPEEIRRVDVMYGPFSAAYPGNAVGAAVVYTTGMPRRFEANARVGLSVQPFELDGLRDTFHSREASASFGSRDGALAWRLSLRRSDSEGQPLTFATRLVASGTPATSTAAVPVQGAVLDANPSGAPWYVLGQGTRYQTTQDQLKLKATWDLTPDLTASGLLGVWSNRVRSRPRSALTDAAGNPVTSGPIRIDGLSFTGNQALGGGDFAVGDESLTHVMQGLTLKHHAGVGFDWELAASAYGYRRDLKRANAAANPWPAAASGGPGTLADGHGSGWVNVAARGIWRPAPDHVVDLGVQLDRWMLRYATFALLGDWRSDPAGSPATEIRGRTAMSSVFGQDAWTFAPEWKAVLGLRVERWQTQDGMTRFSATSVLAHPERRETHVSPKAALSWQASEGFVLKAALGRAVRMPTPSELYGATSTTQSQFVNDPALRPERSWTTELSAESDLRVGTLRTTLFAERTQDAIYAQTTWDAAANQNISRVQNIGRIGTQGFEAVFAGRDVGLAGLDLQANLTWTRSIIEANDGFVATPGDTIGKWQPNIPRWRAGMLAAWRFAAGWTGTWALRWSGLQYRTLNNADTNGATYMGVSRFLVADARLHWRIDRQWSAALGIDNLNNERYWNFHPYPQRNWNAELRFEL